MTEVKRSTESFLENTTAKTDGGIDSQAGKAEKRSDRIFWSIYRQSLTGAARAYLHLFDEYDNLLDKRESGGIVPTSVFSAGAQKRSGPPQAAGSRGVCWQRGADTLEKKSFTG